MGVCQPQGGTGGNGKSFQWLKAEQRKQQNEVVDYNPKYEINIHESILI